MRKNLKKAISQGRKKYRKEEMNKAFWLVNEQLNQY